MDHDLELLLGAAALTPTAGGKITETERFIIDDEAEEILVKLSDGETRHYKIKPMNELFGAGTGVSSLDPRDEIFMPLLLPIEETILEYWDESPGLTDGQVSLVLEQLGMDPAGPANDPLKKRIQFRLRLSLSLNDFSRQDVKLAIRKVYKSVQRHTRDGGPRGYLNFIRDYLP